METATGSRSGPNLKFDVVNLGSKNRVEQDDEAHYADLYTLNHDGLLQVAENPTALQLIDELESFDRSFCHQGDQDVRNRTGTFNIIRLHKDAQNQPVKTCLLESSPSQAATAAQSRSRAQSAHRSVASKDSASTPALGLQELRVCFDGKCLTVQNAPELGLNNGGDHCQWSNIKCTGSKGLRCLKISYSMRTPERDSTALSLSHHFHTISKQEGSNNDFAQENLQSSKGKKPKRLYKSKSYSTALPTVIHAPPQGPRSSWSSKNLNSWIYPPPSRSLPQYLSKDTVRGFTIGLRKDDFENILYEARAFELQSHGSDSRRPGHSTYTKPRPHPKALLLGVLEDFERRQRVQITHYQSCIENKEDDMDIQRRPSNKNGKGLARCSIELSEYNLYLGQLRPKLQYLASAIEALQSCPGLPQSIEELIFLFPQKTLREKAASELRTHFREFWAHQLSEIKSRLFHLKGRGEQCQVNVETLQNRVTGNLLMISNLLQQRENDWIHETETHRAATSQYQFNMLKKQEVIAIRTKRDSTVMKALAVLTALFLPMTFTAVFFSIPFFKWDNPRDTWVLKSPFILYWEITMPMTALLMVVSLSWFLATWLQDRKAAMNEKERESNMEGAAVRERDQRERTTAEDNVAAEILRERRSRVETMTPAGEEDDIRPEHAPNVSTVPAVPTEDTTANILAKPLRRSSFMAVRERQALFDGVDPTILSNAMAT